MGEFQKTADFLGVTQKYFSVINHFTKVIMYPTKITLMSNIEAVITEEFLEQYKGKQPNWGFNGMGYVVYKRTYARPKEDGTTEEWWETVARCINGAQKIGAGYTKEEAEELYDLVFNLKCNFAGRMLWQLGTSTVDRWGANSLLNCWYVSIKKPSDFCFIFENLMLGGGVGFSIRREDVMELPKVKEGVKIIANAEKDADFIVPDSREGWTKLLNNVLDAYFVTGKGFSYSTILVRGSGELIRGFGGKASGPGILVQGIQQIGDVIAAREGKKLRSIDVLDICNIIGCIVVAGNVRRSAEIALGDPDDYHYLRAKKWSLGNVPYWRGASNNTIYADDFDHISNELWDNFTTYVDDKGTRKAKGEPYGFFNLPLSRKQGRLGENRKDVCEGTNPCAEITLAPYECCDLAELYLNNIDSKEELERCSILLYKTQKAILALPFIHEETNKIVHKNMRIGQGVTGICQSLNKVEWLDDTYKALREFDRKWSKIRGWPESIKLTTVKPSGTLSLLAGATPGVHPAYASHYFRTVRMSSSDALVKLCRENGNRIEYALNIDGSEDRGTVVVYFPCVSPDDAILAKDMTAIKQMELVKKLQTIWSDNSVSVTVYYKEEELPEIKEWMKQNYRDGVKSISFLLHQEHGFKQAPYIPITAEEYHKEIKSLKGLINTTSNKVEYVKEGVDLSECASGVCPIK
jgi:adenosylcobalamin-dependent ribonucleoside-triphosphate reductase